MENRNPEAVQQTVSTSKLVKHYVVALRPAFLTASILPVLTSLAYVYSTALTIDYLLATIILLDIVLIHSAGNVLNDYFDARSGNDGMNDNHIHPFTGGSRVIQNGWLSEQQMLVYGSVLLAAGLLLGLVLVLQGGAVVLVIGVTGALLTYFYSAPPCLACRGMGDLTIAICFGLLPALGTVYVLTGALDINALWIGLIIGCFVAAILWINSIPDIDADKQVGKNTWPSRLNKVLALRMHGVWFGVGFVLLILSPVFHWLVLLSLLPAGIAFVTAVQEKLIPAIPFTLITHASVCLLMALSFLL